MFPKLILAAVLLLVLAPIAVLAVWRVSGAASLDAVRSLRRSAQHLHRSLFDRKAEFARRALVRRYTESTVTLSLFVAPLQAGFILPEGRASAQEGIAKARHELSAIFRDLLDERTREPGLSQLAEHIAFDHLLSPSQRTVDATRAFLLTEADLLSDTPHAVDEHVDRLTAALIRFAKEGRG